jgi:hypothetical protein
MYGSEDGIQSSAAVVFKRLQPATCETFASLLAMLLHLLLHYGVLQTVHNLLRFLQIDSEVFRCGTPGESFNRAQCNRRLFAIFSDAFQYDVPAHASSRLVSRANEPYGRNFGQDPQVLSSPVPVAGL